MPPPRPEAENPPDVFYNETGAARYTSSTRVQLVQRAMTLRALELLDIPAGHPALLLDIGCGSGLSGEVLREAGHTWFGVDISNDMLFLAKAAEREDAARDNNNNNNNNNNNEADDDQQSPEKEKQEDLRNVKWGLITPSDGEEDSDEDEDEDEMSVAAGPSMVEVLRGDMGQGLPFRPGSFDGAVSISALQWLCQSDSRGHVPQRRLRALFQCLYNALRRGAKAALQFYPSHVDQVHMITRAAMLCGFNGGVVVDFPHSTKAKKHYLVVQAGKVAGGFLPPPPLAIYNSDAEEEDEEGMECDMSNNDDNDETNMQARARVGGRVQKKRSRSHTGGSECKRRRKDNRPATGSKEWVLLKKEERRKFGLKTTADSKYTMRKRRPRF
ncbi:18S rRNA (guanine(1575)-N(7))-methyltransferase Bud23 [Trypanosoma melophagium]|uniref:18S rRNA (guanine(1575)-N(7))-methyltransferase Bud23 n=1 Tax=Trypanosoma melophagium TaxID=715481 RepID=UPI003519E63E|nr:18S rRNA (guanine(1575)-N(7))-methyltransferase Bud23 [Trypanosoma melophagium]